MNTDAMENKTTHIYCMEFWVNDMRLWKMPGGVSESEPVSFEFRYLDAVQVSIEKDEFGENQNSGKNCLFTMNCRPAPETVMEFDVFAKSDDKPLLIGKGTIQLDEELAGLFQASWPITDANSSEALSDHSLVSETMLFPISKIVKAWYPIFNDESTKSSASDTSIKSKLSTDPGKTVQVGVFMLRLRVTCLGPNIVSPVMENKKIPNDPTDYDCEQIFEPPCPCFSPLSDNSKNIKQSQNHSISNVNAKSPDIIINPPSLTNEKVSNKDTDDFMPVPPVSTTEFGYQQPEFDEYRTVVDENELIVRVTKNKRKVCQISDDTNENMPHCPPEASNPSDDKITSSNRRSPGTPKYHTMTVQDDGNDMLFCTPCPTAKFVNSCGIPVVRGNLKYPTKYEFSSKITHCPNSTTLYRPQKSDPRNCCIKCEKEKDCDAFPEGIELCKKINVNPNIDVYVLKLPQCGGGNLTEDKVELELHTPKSPTATCEMEHRDAQTYEEDFCAPYKVEKSVKGKKKK